MGEVLDVFWGPWGVLGVSWGCPRVRSVSECPVQARGRWEMMLWTAPEVVPWPPMSGVCVWGRAEPGEGGARGHTHRFVATPIGAGEGGAYPGVVQRGQHGLADGGGVAVQPGGGASTGHAHISEPHPAQV